jgi:penicillin-binding protein 1B
VRYGAFLDLVKRQLKRDYRQSDLRTAGLKVFTTLDIVVQSAAEVATRRTLEALEKERPRQQGSLQASTIVVDARTADIRAMVGGRDHRGGEFNRALDAHRQIGSLIKPFIYLTALERLPEFNVASRLSDRPGSWPAGDGRTWTPGNYDGKYFGDIAAETALARSLNLATVRLGFQVGIESVRETLKRLGVEGVIPHFPSLFLGALELTPYEVTQLYQVFANDGFRIPLRAIHAVVDSDNEPIRRYGLKVEPVVNAADAFLVRYLLTRVVDGGTARRVASTFPHGLPLAGKTGTTNDARDSWFAGFTGNDLVTTWIGRDDNQPIGLTGASGALRVWLDLVGRLGAVPVEMDLPPEVEWHWLTPDGSALVPAGCQGALRVPVNVNHLPSGSMPCGQRGIDAPLDHAEPRW